MKKFITRGILFLLLLWVVDKPIGWVMADCAMKRQYDDRIGKLGAKSVQAELLVLGSSRALNDIDVELLHEQTGLSAYGLGFSGSNHVFHLSVLRMALAGGTPKSIVLTIDKGTSFIPNDRSIYRKDLLFPYTSYAPVFKEICKYSKKVFWLGQGFWMYRENNNLITALNYLKNGQLDPDLTSDIDAFGSVMLQGRSAEFNDFSANKDGATYDASEEAEVLVNSLDEIIAVCAEKGINLFLVMPPHLVKNYKGFNERLAQLVNNRAKIIDFSELELNESHYFDAGHLNADGARIFTNALSQEIIDGI